ncbi:unnamed protein product [Brassica oleracea]
MVGMSVQREADKDGKISREEVSGHGGEGDIKDFVVEPDANKACNLCTCLIKQGKVDEARSVLFRDVL